MGVPINYGRCHGGPYDGRHLADHREVFSVAIHKPDNRVRPALFVDGVFADVVFGEYRFTEGVWIWHPPIRSEAQTAISLK